MHSGRCLGVHMDVPVHMDVQQVHVDVQVHMGACGNG